MTRGARDIVVRCPSGHRVRLARGRRFWASARCPRCGSAVDRRRLLRVGRWFSNLARPVSGDWRARTVWMATAAYLGLATLAWVLLWRFGDIWWPATTLLFGPRWILLLPLPVLGTAVLLADRALLVPLLITAAILAGPVVGLRTGWRAFLVDPAPAEDITVASFNARGGETLRRGPAGLMLEWRADIAAFQECGTGLQREIRVLLDWHTAVLGSLCLVSRFEILGGSQMERRVFEAAGGSALVASWTLDLEGHQVQLTDVHLETPRAGLAMIRGGNLPGGITTLQSKSFLRSVELARARAWADSLGPPGIVVGDFNTTVESQAYRAAWSGWRNTFSLVGRGLGGTRLNGWIRARIDHILVDDQWTVVRSWLGRDVGSDHRPILAEIRLRSLGGAIQESHVETLIGGSSDTSGRNPDSGLPR